jgi:pyruvate/2-oxoglutarate dehydrogenase complex dihydrolipoamide acyltransferase (E2) component
MLPVPEGVKEVWDLTYDHCLIDGADGIRFLQWIVETLEDPVRLALEGGCDG